MTEIITPAQADLITRAREEWCETPRYPDTRMANICPPAVVSALLDVLRESMDSGYGPDAEAICVICGGEVRYTGLDTCTFDHATDCKRVKAEAAITRALEGK